MEGGGERGEMLVLEEQGLEFGGFGGEEGLEVLEGGGEFLGGGCEGGDLEGVFFILASLGISLYF